MIAGQQMHLSLLYRKIRIKTAFMLIVFFGMTLPLFGAEMDAEACKIYRHGPLVSKRLAIYKEADIYDWLDIHYRYEYVTQPDLPENAFGSTGPNGAALFDIEITTGQPIDQRSNKSPFEYTHFTLLINGLYYLRDLGRKINIYGSAGPNMPHYQVNGVLMEPVVPFQRTGDWFHGYQRITAPIPREYDEDLFIKESEGGEIASLMRCNRPGSVPNPGCSIYESAAHFTMKFSFNRSKAHLIETIRQQARAFTECLTLEIEEN